MADDRPMTVHVNRRPTEAQHAATMRNWGIRQLRALYAQAHMLLRWDRAAAVQDIIDEELKARGAEPERERQARRRAAIDGRPLGMSVNDALDAFRRSLP